jgi:general secretion pathway protein A
MPLSYPETQKYIRHRLTICGGRSDIFNERAIKRVYNVSKGIPRVINVVCDKALLGTYASGNQFVTAKIVSQAAKEVLGLRSYFVSKKFYLVAAFIGLVLVGLTATVTHFFNKPLAKQQITLSIPLANEKDAHPQQQVVENYTSQVNKSKSSLSDFSLAVNTKKATLDTMLHSLTEIWDKDIPQSFRCDELEMLGLACLFGQSDWKSLIALNRPVIMEFSLSKEEKNYVLLTGIKEGDPVFQFEGEGTFSLDDVLSQWDGYYLMIWKTPLRGIKIIRPNESSRVVLWIKKHLALTHEYYLSARYSVIFDDELKTEIKHFQDLHNLTADGIVGPQTFIHLQNNDPQDDSPKLNLMP